MAATGATAADGRCTPDTLLPPAGPLPSPTPGGGEPSVAAMPLSPPPPTRGGAANAPTAGPGPVLPSDVLLVVELAMPPMPGVAGYRWSVVGYW